jgi:hypothetical protein
MSSSKPLPKQARGKMIYGSSFTELFKFLRFGNVSCAKKRD